MKPRDQDQLLREVLDDDVLAELREESLGRGLAAARARRRRRKFLQACAMGAAPALVLAIGLLRHHAPETYARADATAASPVIAASAAAASDSHAVKMISDAELLALFPNRPVGLIGNPGHQQLVFYDQPELPVQMN